MIISDQHEFIFVHNPKCAGTSVRTALQEFDDRKGFFWMFDFWDGKKFDKAHMPLHLFEQKYPEEFKRVASYFCFMFVRNPYDRAVSAFNEVNSHLVPDSDATDGGAGYAQALNTFICNMRPGAIERNLFKYRHFVRQTDLAYLGHKRLIDVVMKVEDWPGCLSAVRNFHPEIASKLLASKKRNVKQMFKPHKSYLNKQAIQTINQIYKSDFRLLNYDMLGAG